MARTLRPTRRTLTLAATVALVAAAWAVWWVWPPAPEVRWRVPTTDFTFAPDGRTLLVATGPVPGAPADSGLHRCELWDLATLQRRCELTCRSAIEFSPDGSRIAFRDEHGRVQVIAVPSMAHVTTLAADVKRYRWSSDGRRLIDESLNGIEVYDAESGGLVGRLEPLSERRALLPDGSGFVEFNADSRRIDVRPWSADGMPVEGQLPPDPSATTKPAAGMGRINRLLATPDGNGVVAIVERLEADGEKFVIGSYALRLDRPSGRLTECPVDGDPRRMSPNLSADGRLLSHGHVYATGDYIPLWWDQFPRALRGGDNLYDLAGDPPRSLNDGTLQPYMSYHFDPTARRILAADAKRVTVVDAVTLSPSGQARAADFYLPEFDPAGRWVAYVSRPGWPDWWPAPVRSLADRVLNRQQCILRIIRVSDGKICRELNDRANPVFTAQGALWTLTQTPSGISAERWSPEAPGPPWWLWGVTAGGVGMLLWGRCRSCRRLSSKTT